MASTLKQTVFVRLEVINEDDAGESNALRYLTLEAPSYSVRIGRGSRSGSKDLEPAENNAWFDSRVMSREHAILKANIATKTVTIEDVGSMHGTYLPVDDLKLLKYQPQVVRDGDAVIFGAEVSRGPDTFPALEIDVFYSFDQENEEYIGRATPEVLADRPSQSRPGISHNSFSVPDYDDYDSEKSDGSEMEVKFIPPPRLAPAAVPESIISIDASFGSDDDEAPFEPWNQSYCNTFESKKVIRDSKGAHTAMQDATGSTSNGKNAPADVIVWSRGGRNLPDTSNAGDEATASQSPAEGSRSSTSQQAKMQSTMKMQSKSLPAPFMADSLTDEQSESDYGDDISADLFDEEFDMDGYQRAKPQLETSSFSSQPSPTITSSLPSKIELAARQSTVKVPTMPTLPRSPLLGSASVDQRAPSPSDAAMPKVKPVYHSSEYKSPAKGTTTAQPSQYAWCATDALPIPRDTSFMRSYGYTPSQDVNNVQDTYQQPYFYVNPVEGYDDYYSAPPQDHSAWGASQYLSKTDAPAAKTMEQEPWGAPVPAPASPFVTIKTTPRVAIKDLVDEPEKVEGVNQKHRATAFADFFPVHCRADSSTLSGLKRKADQISEFRECQPTSVSIVAVEDAVERSTSQNQENAQVVNKLAFVADSQSQSDVWGPVSMIATPISAPLNADHNDQIVEERPKKKARSDLYKYAAGAAGGIAIGAVGVVAALVSLPSDFFV